MKYMMLVCVDPTRFADDEAPDAADTADTGDSGDSGSFPWLDDVIASGIRPHGDRVRPVADQDLAVPDEHLLGLLGGPFAETKEIICGYDTLECASLEEAV